MLLLIIRILLIWWLATIILRWLGKSGEDSRESRAQDPAEETPGAPPDMVHSGAIEDADFEEMERQ